MNKIRTHQTDIQSAGDVKATPVNADRLWIADSEDGWVTKQVEIDSLPGGGGGGGGSFQRVLNADLALADGESLVVSDYLDLASYDLSLSGDSVLHIL